MDKAEVERMLGIYEGTLRDISIKLNKINILIYDPILGQHLFFQIGNQWCTIPYDDIDTLEVR